MIKLIVCPNEEKATIHKDELRKVLFIGDYTVDSDDDRYADERVDEDAKKQKRGKGEEKLVLCMREP